jgi:hypothetical protein
VGALDNSVDKSIDRSTALRCTKVALNVKLHDQNSMAIVGTCVSTPGSSEIKK